MTHEDMKLEDMKPEEKESVCLMLKPEEKEIILTMAKNDLNATTTAKELHRHRGTVMYWIEKLKKETGLDCRKFYDLVKLVGMVEEIK